MRRFVSIILMADLADYINELRKRQVVSTNKVYRAEVLLLTDDAEYFAVCSKHPDGSSPTHEESQEKLRKFALTLNDAGLPEWANNVAMRAYSIPGQIHFRYDY